MDSASIKAGINAYQNALGIAPKTPSDAPPIDLSPKNQQPGSFGDILSQTLTDAVNTGYKAESAGFSTIANRGNPVDLVTAVTQAELTLQTVVALRDRVVNAYQEILRMPI